MKERKGAEKERERKKARKMESGVKHKTTKQSGTSVGYTPGTEQQFGD